MCGRGDRDSCVKRDLPLDAIAALQGCVQAGDGVGVAHGLKMRRRSANHEQMALQQHQRQPQREQHAYDDHGDEAHRAEGLALNGH